MGFRTSRLQPCPRKKLRTLFVMSRCIAVPLGCHARQLCETSVKPITQLNSCFLQPSTSQVLTKRGFHGANVSTQNSQSYQARPSRGANAIAGHSNWRRQPAWHMETASTIRGQNRYLLLPLTFCRQGVKLVSGTWRRPSQPRYNPERFSQLTEWTKTVP